MNNPFIFKDINCYLESGKLPAPPTIEEKIDLSLTHAKLMIEEFGPERGLKMMRRYLTWYIKGFPRVSKLRPLLSKVESYDDIGNIFDDYLGGSIT